MQDLLQGKKVNVIDNYISSEVCNILYNLMLDFYFPWFFSPNVDSHLPLNKEKGFYSTSQFYHTFIWDNEINCPHANTVSLLTKLNKYSINRLKANNLLNNTQTGTSHRPHIDNRQMSHQLINGIIYLHETDGDTVFYNDEEKEEFRVSPIPGRAVFMDGDVLHASNNPINYSHRIIINLNINKWR